MTLATRGAVPVVPERRPLDASDFLDLAWAHGADGPLMVPLVAKGLRLGSLLVTCPPGVDALSLAALESIGQVADRLAIALDNARLFEGERTARQQFQAACARLVQMQETERRRVARELHDDIGQVLTGLKLDLEAQMRQGRAHQDLEAALTTVQGLMSRVRDLSLDLRPALLDDLGLIPALIAMTERYTAQTGIQVTLDHHRAMGRLPADVETAAFRIIQESLTNIARYAGVREVYVQLETTATALELAVVDRGRGFDPLSASPHRTAGHSGMRERAAMLGGDVTIESAPGAGTAIRAALPTGVPRRRSRRRGPATGPEHR